ncbi:MAG: methyltransferase [Polyangiaceae bacterium]|jgi:TrmH family RNA methyltransferase|nr:methyltransferase [Polyangiaceae bacterium]
MLELQIHPLLRFVLVRPHYPENVGAAARAMKTMGFTRLVLVKPGKMAQPGHVMAVKMAVKSLDVLEEAPVVADVASALVDVDFSYATTARRGVSGVFTARQAARDAVERAGRGERLAFVFGNEKTGLAEEDLLGAHARMRIPMAADQPSINLGQAVQVTAYELFIAALEARERDGGARE